MNMNMCSLLFPFTVTLLLLAASCTHSLPAARHAPVPVLKPDTDAASDAPPLRGASGGPVHVQLAEAPSEGSGGRASDQTAAPRAEQKVAILRENLNNANTLFTVMMALQLRLEAGDPFDQSLVRKECNATVARLAPADDTAAACPLKYTCNYHRDRYPNFVVEAECQSLGSPCVSCGSKDPAGVRYCLEVSERFRSLERSPSDGTWRRVSRDLVTSCRCSQ